MLLVGRSLTAYFTAWQLLATGTPFEWWANPNTSAAEGIPELALLPCATLSLSHHGIKLWQQVAEQLPVVRAVPFADLATTPGRVEKLREEAMLDALAGQVVEYRDIPPQGVHPRLVLGARYCAAAAQLAPDFVAQLKAALPQQPMERVWADGEGFINQIPPNMPKVLIADDALAANLGVPVQPRRRHSLVWQLPKPLPFPEAPLLLLHRMPRGHAWLLLEPTSLTLIYDGVADTRQATLADSPDMPTIEALTAHAQQVLPYLRVAGAEAPRVQVTTDWVMPDTLPYLGPWMPPRWQEALDMRGVTLFMVGGAGAREAIYAPALAEKLVEVATVQEFMHMPLAPSASRQTEVLPESLRFIEPPTAWAAAREDEAKVVQAQHTQIAEEPEIKRMEDVRMVGKEVSRMGAVQDRDSRKPKVQRAAIKN